ncbi:hypothetical protein BG000_012023 [Podila horticola]|nr:hypothetical protein BG000_012023 [Podila horticola]
MEPAPEYNVLVLGETQSGKSALIQYMRKYADSSQIVDNLALGNGVHSHTMEVISTAITTDLPEYYVTKNDGSKVNYGEHMTRDDEHDYEESLKLKDLKLEKGHSRLAKKLRFNLIDTPGLNTTKGADETHIQKIFDNLMEAKTINLVLITVSCGPVTRGLKDSIQAYADLFPGFKGIMAFVHTRFDYENLHPTRIQESQAIDLKTNSLHEIMGRTTFPHFKIDCNVLHSQVTRDCITLNTIQKILELAKFNRPVDMLHTTIHKSSRMRTIDNILRDKFEAIYDHMFMTLKLKDREQAELLAEIFRRETKVHNLEAQIRALDEYFAHHDVGLLELLHENRLEMEYAEGGEGVTGEIRYPKIGESSVPIVGEDILCRRVNVLEQAKEWNGEGSWTSWKADVQRTSSDHSIFHYRIYSTKAHVHQAEIQKKRREHAALRRQLKDAIEHRNGHTEVNKSKETSIKVLVDTLNEGIQILRQVCHQSLTPETFKALLDDRAYDGDIDACAKKVQKKRVVRVKKKLLRHQKLIMIGMNRVLRDKKLVVKDKGRLFRAKKRVLQSVKSYEVVTTPKTIWEE